MLAARIVATDKSNGALSKELGVPLYHQIQHLVRHRIHSGLYPPGTQIPSEHDLCRELSVSRVTLREALRELVREIAGPLNVVMGLGSSEGNARALLAAGVQRISLGGSIARAALGFVRRCAQELRDAGSIGFAAAQIPQSELNALFARARTAAAPLASNR